jgi:glycosyltransferase involved in cell wall biosynthesis
VASRAKVVVLIKGLGIGGAERLISEAVAFWDRDRYDYQVAYLLPWKDQLVPEITGAGVQVDQIGNGRVGIKTWRHLRAHLKEARPDLVHAHLPSTGILARLASHAPVIYTEHNVVSSYRQPTRLLNRLTYGRNSRLIAVSGAVADSVAGFPGPDPIIVPNGVSVSVSEQDRRAAREELEISDTTLMIIHVGNIRPHKGHSNLIAATAKLKGALDDFVVVSIGGEKYDGDLARIQAEAAGAGVEDVFRALGRRENALSFVAASDVMAHPSDHEGLPLAILEAMSLGKPVVATAVGGVPSVIESGVNGLLVPAANPAALADSLLDLANDHELRARLGGQAREDALAKHGLEAMIRTVEGIYAEVLANPAA